MCFKNISQKKFLLELVIDVDSCLLAKKSHSYGRDWIRRPCANAPYRKQERHVHHDAACSATVAFIWLQPRRTDMPLCFHACGEGKLLHLVANETCVLEDARGGSIAVSVFTMAQCPQIHFILFILASLKQKLLTVLVAFLYA